MPKPKEVAGIRYAVMLAGSQVKLSKVLGLSKTTINKWVRQGYVPDEWVKPLHKLYGIASVRLCNPAYLALISDEEYEDEDE
jgi:hypothetical protein